MFNWFKNLFQPKLGAFLPKLTDNYITEVQRGNIPGQTMVVLSGSNPDMGAGVQETIWNVGGMYTYLSADTQLYISSTNASDIAVELTITGLDSNYEPVSRTVTTNGQNQVALSGTIFRTNNFFVTGSTASLGDLYLAESDTLTDGVPDTASKIKGKIVQGKNQSASGFLTVPAGKTWYGWKSYFLTEKGSSITFSPAARFFPHDYFYVDSDFGVYQNVLELDITDLVYPEKTDLEARGTADNNGTLGTVFSIYIQIDN